MKQHDPLLTKQSLKEYLDAFSATTIYGSGDVIPPEHVAAVRELLQRLVVTTRDNLWVDTIADEVKNLRKQQSGWQHATSMLAQLPRALAGSDHGDPTLLNHDVQLLTHYTLWVETVRQWREKDNPSWLPSEPDWLKSRLFWRIRSGKPPLPYPPPCSFSCPWYEIIEDLVPHNCGPKTFVHFYWRGDDIFGGSVNDRDWVSINQGFYDIIETLNDKRYKVAFGPYRFDLYEGTYQRRFLDSEKQVQEQTNPCWYLQRKPEWETP